MESRKQLQTAETVKRKLSHVLVQEGSYIYGIEPMVTITSVKMSPDLGIAKVFLSIYNYENKNEIMFALDENASRLRHLFAKQIRNQVRRIPDLVFKLDESLDEVEKLDQIFKNIKAKSSK